jgi:hypothetical protein
VVNCAIAPAAYQFSVSENKSLSTQGSGMNALATLHFADTFLDRQTSKAVLQTKRAAETAAVKTSLQKKGVHIAS